MKNFTLLSVLIFLIKLLDTIMLWLRSSKELVEPRKYGGEWFDIVYILLLGASIYLGISISVKPGNQWFRTIGIIFSLFTIILYTIDFFLGISIVLGWW